MSKNLVIVESPAKAKTIERFLGKEFTVKSSFGHVRDLSKNQISVDVENDFVPQYVISPDKKKIITELKKIAKDSEMIWLATDEDREGEAISWHLLESLGLDPAKTKRIVFHEITKNAILEAIEKPRSIDKNLVDAQQARRVLDRLVGYELSPLLWKKVKPALSAGRVQSVAVRLIVEREEEIKKFKPTSSFRVIGNFSLGNSNRFLQAELNKKFPDKEQAKNFLEENINAAYKIEKVEKKPSKKNPAPPFTTSTLQQEASRKLGFSVSKTMMVAQQLYESGKITYMRTDSVSLSKLALSMAKKEIEALYGDKYVKTRQFATKSKGAQEAHEAIRPTYLQNKEIDGDASQKRLYDLIWKRTIASQMAEAILEKTNATIDISTRKEKFVASGEVIKFDGFLKVYMESTDDPEDEKIGDGVLPPLKNNDPLNSKEITAIQRFTKHIPRYTEASLVKKMEELGIGRPSTYAPTISTIQKREYVEKVDRTGLNRNYDELVLKDGKLEEKVKSETYNNIKAKLVPTDLGIVVNSFLMQYFLNILDYNFTANVEKEFDEIADGKKVWNSMIKEFYGPFHNQIEETREKSAKFSGEKLLGQDPESGKNVFVKIGRYGPIVQIGDTESEEKPRFAGLKKDQTLDTITLDEALDLFKFPKLIGQFEGSDVTVAIGRFGPYVKLKNEFFSLKKEDDPSSIKIERAIELIEEKRRKAIENTIKLFDNDENMQVLKGRYGAYIKFKKKNYKLPKGTKPEELSYEDCLKIVEESDSKGTKKKTARRKTKS